MKKTILMLGLGILSSPLCASGAYEVPYSSVLSENQEMSAEWSSVDTEANGADYNGQRADEWAYPTGSVYAGYFNEDYPAGVILYENQLNVTDPDRLISPAINLEAGKEYRVRYATRTKWAATTTFNPAGSLYLVSEEDTEGANPIQTITEFASQGDTAWKNYGYVFTPETSGAYRFVYSIAIRYKSAYCCFTNFQVVENEFIPAPPSALKAVAGTSENPRALSVTLSWTDPTTDYDGLPFGENQVLDSVLIFRDGGDEAIAEIADGAASWTDTEETGLTSGFHTYSFVAVVSGVKSSPASLSTAYVGPVVPFDLPVSLTTSVKEDFDLLWSYDNNGITSAFGWQYQTAQKLAYCSYSQISGDGNDCWLFSPALNFTTPGTYRLVLNAGTTLVDGQTVKVAYGSSASPSAMDNVIKESLELAMTTWTGTDSEPMEFTVTEPGEYHIGIKTQTSSDRGFNYFVRRIDLTCQAAAAVFSPEGGEVEDGTEVTITSATPGAVIYYTVDGTDPTEESELYSEAIVVDDDMTVKALVTAQGFLPSAVSVAEYTIKPISVPEALYLFGEINDNNWNPGAPVEMEKNGSVFTAEGRLGSNGNFGISEVKSTDWNLVNAARWCGPEGDCQPVACDVETVLVKGSDALHCDPGYYTFTVTFSDREVTLTVTETEDPKLSVEGIEADNGFGEVYNLQGIRVLKPESGSVYLVRKGQHVEKQILH